MIIQWHDLLLLLEHQLLHLATQKSHFSKDLEFHNDIPSFCTTPVSEADSTERTVVKHELNVC